MTQGIASIFGRFSVIAALAFSPAAFALDGPTPDEAMKNLTDGNQRFSAGAATNPRSDEARRAETAEKGQKPFATILTCSDSRLAAERIFDQGVGDLFIVRVAGNVADTDEIGSIEYGVGHLHTPLLVVMGHTSCGAVKAVVAGAELEGHLPQLVDNIEPAVKQTRRANPAVSSEILLNRSIEANVFQSISDILERSSEVRELAKEGKLKIVGAVYDISNGNVRWLGTHPEQSSLVFGKRSTTPGKAVAGGQSSAAPSGGHGASGKNAVAVGGHGTNGKGAAAGSGHGATGKTAVAGATASKSPAGAGGDSHTAKPATGGEAHAATSGGHDQPVAHANAGGKGDAHAASGGGKDAHGTPSGPNATQAFEFLRDGNRRFATGSPQHPHSDKARLTETAGGQNPFATVLTCSDSRVSPERLFDRGIGDIFVVRVAGNVADTDQFASIEYATAHLNTPLLVVLGHTACGAVSAVANNAEVHGSIPPLVENIQPAVARARNAAGGQSGNAFIAMAIKANVWQSMNDLLTSSPVIRKRVADGRLKLVGGVYDIATGTIDWIEDPLAAVAGEAKPAPAKAEAQQSEPKADAAMNAEKPEDGHGGGHK